MRQGYPSFQTRFVDVFDRPSTITWGDHSSLTLKADAANLLFGGWEGRG